MRCSDCAKFVSMENGEPEVNEITATYDAASTSVTVLASLRHTRNCVECSNELKSLDIEIEESFDITESEPYKALTPEQKVQMLDALEANDGGEVSIEETGTESEESGGNRYKKNLITVTLRYDVVLTNGKEDNENITLLLPGQATSENAASSYEEQV